MAELSRFLFWKHLRSESSSTILFYKDGRLLRSGRGLSFWFYPLTSSIAELPLDDGELTVLFKGSSSDFQEVNTEAVITWRVADPEVLAQRVDFTIDLRDGRWKRGPLDKVGTLLTQLAQQMALGWMASHPLEVVLRDGVEVVRGRVDEGLRTDQGLRDMGIAIQSVRISAIKPTADVEKALQTPTRESIQQSADKATFERRALAVERERAIAENELQNRIELARREEVLIAQKGANERRRVTDEAESQAITAQAAAERSRVENGAKAEGIRLVEGARVEAERAHVEIYRQLQPGVLQGLALKELAAHPPAIGHLSLGSEALSSVLSRLATAGAEHMEGGSPRKKG
jgi:regulator of protease activity HflC (stomatin/prohibitin superfamily)